ncbi:hypothetical protein LPJ70_000377 [Coemansia sp. RSA 2708]|nr:hypothetical protein LPJ70_000377 [Coemansia sp. RSA 2708]
MRGFVTLATALLASSALVQADADYDSFMSSLSYNWQNEFSDLRYQVEQLQKNDPQKYSQLAASLGLKAGTKISIPSQYSPDWASKFVQAANLYTPPQNTNDDAKDVATPTNSLIESIENLTQLITATANDDGEDSDSKSDGSDDEDHSDQSDEKSNDDSASTDGDGEAASGLDSDGGSTSTQFGNPIVGNFNGANTPIVPTGQGYSAAASVRPLAIHIMATLSLAIWLLVLSA